MKELHLKYKIRILEELQQNLEEHLKMKEILNNHHEEPPERTLK
jgi:hypothetical protein